MANRKTVECIFIFNDQSTLNSFKSHISNFGNQPFKMDFLVYGEKSPTDFSGRPNQLLVYLKNSPPKISGANYITLVSNRMTQTYEEHYDKCSLVGYQRHLLQLNALKSIDVNGLEHLSLGKLLGNLGQVEHIFASSDYIVYDYGVMIKDHSHNSKSTPFGLTAHQFVQLVKYAGYSDELSNLFLVHDIWDEHAIEVASTACWYLIESLVQYSESEEDDNESFILAHEDLDDILLFKRNLVSGKCWLEISPNKKIPCSREEYDLIKSKGVLNDRLSFLI